MQTSNLSQDPAWLNRNAVMKIYILFIYNDFVCLCLFYFFMSCQLQEAHVTLLKVLNYKIVLGSKTEEYEYTVEICNAHIRFIYIYIYIYINMYIYIYAHRYLFQYRTRTHTHIYIYIYIYTNIRIIHIMYAEKIRVWDCTTTVYLFIVFFWFT